MLNNLHIFANWLFNLDRWEKRLILAFFDCTSVIICLALAFLLRLETFVYLNSPETYIIITIAAPILLITFYTRGLYSSFTRHFSSDALGAIILGCGFSSLSLYFSDAIFGTQLKTSIPLIYCLLLFFCVTSLRFGISVIGQNIIKEKRKNVVIYGTGREGMQLIHALKWHPEFRVCLLIDDNRGLDGQRFAGIPIKNFDKAKTVLETQEIEILLVAVPSIDDRTRSKLSQLLSSHPLKIKAIPTMSDLITDNSKITELKDIPIEDLLGREPAKPAMGLMTEAVTGKSVLVTGAGGSIGSEICRQIIQWAPRELILLDVSEYSIYQIFDELSKTKPKAKIIPIIGSVQDKQVIRRIFDRFEIDTVYHAAAYKHVPLMEQNIMQCVTNNVFGTLNMVDQAVLAKVKSFLLVSTDKAVNPASIMGASKRFAELLCQTAALEQQSTKISIVRFGNVLGSSGSVVPLFKKQISHGGPITLTHDAMTRYFMTISEAAQLVIQAGSLAKGGEVFVLDMGPPIKIIDLAKKMVVLAGKRPTINNPIKSEGEISICLTGLRPGEKLHEELSYNPTLETTAHPRIHMSDEREISRLNLKETIPLLREAVCNNDYNHLIHILNKSTDDHINVNMAQDIFLN